MVFSQAKNDSKIIVSKSDTAMFNKLCLLLYEQGFTLKQKDKEIGFVATDPKTYNGATYRLKFLVKDSTVNITGDVYNDFAAALIRGRTAANISKDESYYTPIKNMGMKGSTIKDAWNQMVKIAKLISEDLTYAK